MPNEVAVPFLRALMRREARMLREDAGGAHSSRVPLDIKAFRLLTQHPTPPKALWKGIRERLPEDLAEKRNVYMRDFPHDLQAEAVTAFRDALMPLHSSAEHLEDFQLAVEFRNGRWLDEENMTDTLDFLERHSLAYVCVDEPQGFKSSVPPVVAVNAPVAEVRFHGRNAENWEKKGISAAERFRYDYSKEELAEWVPGVRTLAESADTVHALMNNCYSDYGIRSARYLQDLLDM